MERSSLWRLDSSRRPTTPQLILWLLILAYVVFFSWLSIRHHDALLTHTADLGNMDQPIWNTLHGRFLEETRPDGRQSSRLTDHFEPIFALISLVFLLWDDVRALLVLQTVAIALGALPAFLIARERFAPPGLSLDESRLHGEWPALPFAAAYLLFPALQAANLAEFHAVPLALPLLMGAYYFGVRGRLVPLAVLSLLALAVKEDVSLLVFMLGLYLVWRGRPRWAGAALAGVSLVWFAVATFVIIPAVGSTYYAGMEDSLYFSRYAELGSGPREIILNMLRQPGQTVALLLTPARLQYVAGLLASVGFLALLDPLTTLIGLPLLLANLLSSYWPMYSGEMHYSAPLVPFFVLGGIGGAGWLVDAVSRRGWVRRSTALWIVAGWLVVASAGYAVLRGYTPAGLRYNPPAVTAHARLLERFASQIPADAAISTTPALFPHVDHRERVHQFPMIADAEYALIDAAGTTDMSPNDVRAAVAGLQADGWGVVDAADGYLLMARDPSPPPLSGQVGEGLMPDEFYSFVRVAEAEPDYPYAIDFGGVVRFLGFTLVDDPIWHMVRVETYWEVLAPPPATLRLFPFLIDAAGQVVSDPLRHPPAAATWYPPAMWQPGDILRLEMPRWNAGEAFSVCVGVLDGENWADEGRRLPVTGMGRPAGGTTTGLVRSAGFSPLLKMRPEGRATNPVVYAMPGNWVRLETFVQAPAWRGGWYEPARLADAPAPAVRVDATFGGEINLAGYTLGEPVGMGRPEGRTTNSEAPVRSTGFSPLRLLLPEGRSTNVERGQVVPLTLHWSAASPPAHDYIVFVHVVGEDGTSLPQDDSMPAWYGQLPTSAWRPGEVVADTRAVRVPADAAAGRYELRAGLYLWETMERLPAADAAGAPLGDYVVLGSLEVVE